MKTMRKLTVGAALTLLFTLPVFAGDIHTTVTSQPPTEQSITMNGQIEIPVATGDISTPAPTSDSIIQVALNLVRGVLSLF
jgi:hypothetical protein